MSSIGKCVLYVRSSKDRHDVSIDAQRDELARVARTRGLEIAREYVDVVESAKDEHRPAFQDLRAALRDRGRGWSVVLLLEPSRLSRNQFVAHWFTHDAKQNGVTIVYAKMPESNPMVDLIIVPLMHGFAEYHSHESRQKGLAGMAENVKRGFRAGGRAPAGYRLFHENTGATRDGNPVTKSRLEPDDQAPAIGRYLQLRAAGVGRRDAIRRAGVDLAYTTLIGIEWNALTYAGCTVWNVQTGPSSRVRGAPKRRPRAEWQLKEGTHQAFITRAEAEHVLGELERQHRGRRDRAPEDYLLGGILQTAAGEAWQGCRDDLVRYYRRGRRVRAEPLERAVMAKITQDLRSPRFLQALVRDARRLATPDTETEALARAWADVEALDRKIEKMTGILGETDARRPLLAQIAKWEAERESIRAGVVDLETRLRQARAIAGITERDILRVLDTLASDMKALRPDQLRDFIRGIVDRVVLDPSTLTCRIHYQIAAISGDKMATPRRAELNPVLRAWSQLRLAA